MKKLCLLGAVGTILMLSQSITAEPITIGPYTFSAGANAFPDSATYLSGETVYIDHPDGGSWQFVNGNTTTDLNAAITGSDITFGLGGSGINVDVGFQAAKILNGPGYDLVFFETESAEDFELALHLGTTLTSFQIYTPVFTGLTINDVLGSGNTVRLNAVEVDLSDFGIAPGATIETLRLYTEPGGNTGDVWTAGADIVAVGALHVVLTPTIEELLERIESLEDHTHTYLTGSGNGHNNTEAETGPVEFPEE